MKGRKPVPAGIKALKGDPGSRSARRTTPSARKASPRPPAVLSPLAAREWRRVVRSLKRTGLVTGLDRAVLAGYCTAWARWTEAETKAAQFGLVITTKTGKPMGNPYLSVASKAMEQVRRLAGELGLTPSSRVRLAMPAEVEDDPLLRYLADRPRRLPAARSAAGGTKPAKRKKRAKPKGKKRAKSKGDRRRRGVEAGPGVTAPDAAPSRRKVAEGEAGGGVPPADSGKTKADVEAK